MQGTMTEKYTFFFLQITTSGEKNEEQKCHKGNGRKKVTI